MNIKWKMCGVQSGPSNVTTPACLPGFLTIPRISHDHSYTALHVLWSSSMIAPNCSFFFSLFPLCNVCWFHLANPIREWKIYNQSLTPLPLFDTHPSCPCQVNRQMILHIIEGFCNLAAGRIIITNLHQTLYLGEKTNLLDFCYLILFSIAILV